MMLPPINTVVFHADEEDYQIIRSLYQGVSELDRMIIILPVTQSILRLLEKRAKDEHINYREKGDVAKLYGRVLGEYYFEQTIGGIVRSLGGKARIVSINVKTATRGNSTTIRRISVRFEIELAGRRSRKKLTILPWALEFSRLREGVKRLIPILTQQARYFFGWIIKKAEELLPDRRKYETLRQLRDHLARIISDKDDRASFEMATHVSSRTIENMLRGINLLINSGLFDVRRRYRAPDGTPYYFKIIEPVSYGCLMKRAKGRVILVDLHMLSREEYIVVYRILNEVFRWKKEAYVRGETTHPVIVIIDEAHRYFPAAGFGEPGSIELVERQITYIARLGRARGLGLFFATHSPNDVSKVILQLTNTKIALRCEEDLLEKVGIPKGLRDLISNTKDRIAAIRSHVLRRHYVVCRTPPPLCGHYDMSILMSMARSQEKVVSPEPA